MEPPIPDLCILEQVFVLDLRYQGLICDHHVATYARSNALVSKKNLSRVANILGIFIKPTPLYYHLRHPTSQILLLYHPLLAELAYLAVLFFPGVSSVRHQKKK